MNLLQQEFRITLKLCFTFKKVSKIANFIELHLFLHLTSEHGIHNEL